MTIFGIKTEPSNEVNTFIANTKERMANNEMLKNPFNAGIVSFNNLYIIRIDPLYFNFSIFAWLPTIMIFYLWGFSFWLIPCFIIIGMGLFWSMYFYYFMFKLGLRKAGYKGSIQLVRPKEILKEVYFNEPNRDNRSNKQKT